MQKPEAIKPHPPSLPHPVEIEVMDWKEYALIIDARSPREYAEDHIPGAINLPVVNDTEYAEVGTLHRTDTHAAYMIGVHYSLRNISRHIQTVISKYSRRDRMLVYCFRGGKRSKLWADNLRTIGFEVEVIKGGWKNYRRWVNASLETLPRHFDYRVLAGSTGCGKTRLLKALAAAGQQIIDLEEIASHRGSLLGRLPGTNQPSQKYFDTLLLEHLRSLDPERPVWVEAESKKIGRLQLPDSLYQSMHQASVVSISAPMRERVRLWREDYPHLAQDPGMLVDLLQPLKPLVGGQELAEWRALAVSGSVDELFERVMTRHYDVCYERSTRQNYSQTESSSLHLESLQSEDLKQVAKNIAERFG